MGLPKSRSGRGTGVLHIGADYTEEELAFLSAMRHWMERTRVKFPHFTDVLAVAKALGYRKVSGADADFFTGLEVLKCSSSL